MPVPTSATVMPFCSAIAFTSSRGFSDSSRFGLPRPAAMAFRPCSVWYWELACVATWADMAPASASAAKAPILFMWTSRICVS